MRNITFTSSTREPLVVDGPVPAGFRQDLRLSAQLIMSGGTVAAPCLRCPEHPCESFSEAEMPTQVGGSRHVCPVDAVSFEPSGRVQIGDLCVSCGLCSLRCPYGALELSEHGRPSDHEPDVRFVPATDDQAFGRYWSDFHLDERASASDRVAYIHSAVQRARGLSKTEFYPLVAHLLTAAGFPSVVTPVGDTSNRIDVIVVHDTLSLPAEVKSPTESLFLNVKSVQQALENKIVIDSRGFRPTNRKASSLVIGYQYHASRSDIDLLVDDIETVYQVRIGLVDLASLWRLAIERTVDGTLHPWQTLSSLKGAL